MQSAERDYKSMSAVDIIREQLRLLEEIRALSEQTQTAQTQLLREIGLRREQAGHLNERLGSEVASVNQSLRKFRQDGIPARVVDFDMSLEAMVLFMFKCVVASIPIAIVLAILLAILGSCVYGF